MDDWITVRQAAQILDVARQRVYALIAAGTLSSRKLGLTRVVNRRSVAIYKESPTRNKFASGGKKQGDLFAPEQLQLEIEQAAEMDDLHWSGVTPPTLSTEARRLYDASPIGARERRDAARLAARGGEI